MIIKTEELTKKQYYNNLNLYDFEPKTQNEKEYYDEIRRSYRLYVEREVIIEVKTNGKRIGIHIGIICPYSDRILFRIKDWSFFIICGE